MSELVTSPASVDEKQYIETVDKLSQLFQDQAMNHDGQMADGAPDGYVWAGYTFTLTFGTKGGIINGWITYHDGSKLRFYGETTYRHGFPIAMAGGLPAVLVAPREKLLNAGGNFTAAGFGTGGAVVLSSNGNLVSPLPWPVAGAGFLHWDCRGTCRFTAG